MKTNQNRNKYALYGMLFGLCFPIIGSMIQCYVSYMDISIDNLIKIQKISPLLWIIDTAPIFLGLFASFGGIQLDRLADKNMQLSKRYDEMKRLRLEAETANQAKSSFLAKMSHEIRTPMNAVLGLTYLSLKEKLNPKLKDNLQKIDRSGKSLLNIINDILDFSKIEAGEFSIEKRSFIFENIINEVIDVMNIKMKDKERVEFICDYDHSIPEYIVSDSSRLKQILINLLNNAIKFTDQGEIILKCTSREIENAKLVLDFEVVDTGIGIAKDKQKEIFDPFKQEDDSTTRKYGGTGLGLVITKSLVELLGGDIHMVTKKGEGTTFKFSINAELPNDVALNAQNGKNLSGLRVLLVDDSNTSRNTLQEILESFKFQVFSASSAVEGISLFMQQKNMNIPIDLIIADWYMPEMDGLEMIEKLKKIGNEQSVLMVTAYGAELLREAKKSNQIDNYLLKPVSPSILFDSIQQALSKKSMRVIDEHNISNTIENFKSKLNGFHILIVEDNEINRELIIELLKDVGITCDVATNGQESLEKVVQKKYAAVLMDIQMPIMDGLTASREIRKIQELKELPVIAMTAHAMVGEREKSLMAGMNEHITKPINPGVLYETLCTYLVRVAAASDRADLSMNSIKKTETIKFPPIKGIDVQDGLKRVGNKEELYVKLLNGFIKKFNESSIEILQYWESKKTINLMETLHTIGGVAGNIGATDLSQEMLAVSGALSKEKNDVSEEHIKSITLRLEKIISEIEMSLESKPNSLIKKVHQKQNSNRIDFEKDRVLLEKMIKTNNPKSIAFLDEILNNHVLSIVNNSIMTEVLADLNELEFDKALEKLDRLK